MQLRKIAVISIGANTSEVITPLKEWSEAYKGHVSFSFCHIDKEDDVDTLPLEETKMAVVLFDVCDKRIREMVMHIAERTKSAASKLVLGISTACEDCPTANVMGLDGLAFLTADGANLTTQWFDTARIVISPMLVRCMTSVDYHDLHTILAQSGTFLTYAGGEHNSIAEAVEELTVNECWATILHSQRKILSIHAASATLSTMKGEMLDPIARLIEKLEADGEAFKWGIYEDLGVTEGKFRIEIIAAKLLKSSWCNAFRYTPCLPLQRNSKTSKVVQASAEQIYLLCRA